MAAAQARNTLCPEVIRMPGSGTGLWIAGGGTAAGLFLLIWLSPRKKLWQVQPAGVGSGMEMFVR